MTTSQQRRVPQRQSARRLGVAGLCLLVVSLAFPGAAGAAPVPPGAVVADSFDRPDSASLGQTDTGQSWTVFSGTPRIVGGQAEAPGPGYSLAVVDTGITAGTAAITIVAPTPEFWLVVRDTDTANYWRFGRWHDEPYQLQQVVDNVLGSPAITMMTTRSPAPGDRLSCGFGPSGLSCSVNAGVVVTTADPFNVDGRFVGLAAFTEIPARFDDLLVTAPAPPPVVCGPSSTPAITHGSASGVDAVALGLPLINKLGSVSTMAPGGPATQAAQTVTASVAGLVSATVQGSASSSSLNPSTSSASSTVSNVDLLLGGVTVTSVKAASMSVASSTLSSFSGAGSTIQGLKVNGVSVGVAPNTKVAVKLLGISVAELYISQGGGTSSSTVNATTASHSTVTLRLVLVKSVLGLPAGTVVTIGSARTDAQSPTILCV